MKLKVLYSILLIILATYASAQHSVSLPKRNSFADLSVTGSSNQGTAAVSYVYNFRIGKNSKIEAGFGLRNTTYSGRKKDFITAGPARLTRTSTTPFLIFFAGQRAENFDTLVVQRPFTNSLNATVNLGYHFTNNFYAGFNIDLIGFTAGSKTSGIFKSNGKTTTEPIAKPSAFNLLLTGDHDYGTLNSEFFLKYKVADRWSVKALYQFIFIEYKTTTLEQTASDGTIITRFRNKANNFGVGVSYDLNR